MLKRKLENEAESSGASDGEKFIDQSGLPSPGSSPLPASGLSLVAMVDNHHPPRKLMKKNSKECFFFGFSQNHKCYLEIEKIFEKCFMLGSPGYTLLRGNWFRVSIFSPGTEIATCWWGMSVSGLPWKKYQTSTFFIKSHFLLSQCTSVQFWKTHLHAYWFFKAAKLTRNVWADDSVGDLKSVTIFECWARH